MPQLKVLLVDDIKLAGKIMAVFANAKMGIINRFTGLFIRCSIACNFSVGIKNANTTPAMVA